MDRPAPRREGFALGLHRAVALPLALAALALQGIGLYFLLDFEQSTGDVLAFLAFHLAASLLVAFVAHGFLPARYRRPRIAGLALLASFAFFIPLLGILAMVIGVVAVMTVPGGPRTAPFAHVRTPEFSPPLQETAARMRATGIRTLLLDPTLPQDLRLRSLTALQNIPIRRAEPVLRRLLGDPADDMRLSAYGLLDRESKRVSGTIERELAALERAASGAERVGALRRVAEQYWELVYTGLAQADLATYAIEAGLRHADQALTIAPGDAGLHVLRGRLLNARGDTAGATAAYGKAITAGMAVERVAPYLAEIAFEARRFDEVARHMAAARPAAGQPGLAPIVRFWTEGSTAR